MVIGPQNMGTTYHDVLERICRVNGMRASWTSALLPWNAGGMRCGKTYLKITRTKETSRVAKMPRLVDLFEVELLAVETWRWNAKNPRKFRPRPHGVQVCDQDSRKVGKEHLLQQRLVQVEEL
jgi:hypothetical protein